MVNRGYVTIEFCDIMWTHAAGTFLPQIQVHKEKMAGILIGVSTTQFFM